MTIKRLRVILLILALAVVLIPIIIVGITGKGLGELASHLLISTSILSLVAATWLGPDQKNKDKRFAKGAVCIGLLIVLISVWF